MRTALPLEGSRPTARNAQPTSRRRHAARVAVGSAVAAALLSAVAAPAHAAPLPAGTVTASVASLIPVGGDIVLDRFARSVTSGWGVADTGGRWVSSNSAATFSVSSDGGHHRVPRAHTAYSHLVGATTTDADVRVDLSLDGATTGGGVYASVLGRKVGTSGDYRTRVRVRPDGSVILQAARSTTSLAAKTVPNLRWTTGTKLAVRLQVTGTFPTTVRAKVWKAGTTEPSTWQVSATDSTRALQAAGGVGVTTYVSSNATRPAIATYSGLRVVPTTAPTSTTSVVAPNAAPVAVASTTVTDLSVALDATASTDPDGRIATYAWTYGDGTTAAGATATHTYRAAGTYPVTLTVTDDRGATATTTRTVTAVAPNVAPTAVATTTATHLAVALDATASSDPDGAVRSFAWDTGDGTTITGATATHTYRAAGTYPVTLTVTDDRGATATTTRSVTVAPAPAPVVAAAGAVKPDASNTGVPAGTRLTVHDGNLTITTPGAVIDGLDIRGRVNIKAPNVTIKNSIVRGGPAVTAGASLITVNGDTYSLTLQDSEVFAANPSPHINGIVGRNLTVLRSDIHHVVDQVHITGSNVRVESSWLHDNLHYPAGVDPNHSDGTHDDNVQVQAGTNITLLGNTMTGSHNAALMVTQDRGPVSNIAFTKNWADNGACTINIAEKTYGPVLGATVTDSTFGRGTRLTNCAVLAKVTTPVKLTNNRYTDGATVTVRKG